MTDPILKRKCSRHIECRGSGDTEYYCDRTGKQKDWKCKTKESAAKGVFSTGAQFYSSFALGTLAATAYAIEVAGMLEKYYKELLDYTKDPCRAYGPQTDLKDTLPDELDFSRGTWFGDPGSLWDCKGCDDPEEGVSPTMTALTAAWDAVSTQYDESTGRTTADKGPDWGKAAMGGQSNILELLASASETRSLTSCVGPYYDKFFNIVPFQFFLAKLLAAAMEKLAAAVSDSEEVVAEQKKLLESCSLSDLNSLVDQADQKGPWDLDIPTIGPLPYIRLPDPFTIIENIIIDLMCYLICCIMNPLLRTVAELMLRMEDWFEGLTDEEQGATTKSLDGILDKVSIYPYISDPAAVFDEARALGILSPSSKNGDIKGYIEKVCSKPIDFKDPAAKIQLKDIIALLMGETNCEILFYMRKIGKIHAYKELKPLSTDPTIIEFWKFLGPFVDILALLGAARQAACPPPVCIDLDTGMLKDTQNLINNVCGLLNPPEPQIPVKTILDVTGAANKASDGIKQGIVDLLRSISEDRILLATKDYVDQGPAWNQKNTTRQPREPDAKYRGSAYASIPESYKEIFPYKLFFWNLLEPDGYGKDLKEVASSRHVTKTSIGVDEKVDFPNWYSNIETTDARHVRHVAVPRSDLSKHGMIQEYYGHRHNDYKDPYGFGGIYTWTMAMPLGFFAHEFSTEFGSNDSKGALGYTGKIIKDYDPKDLGIHLWHNTSNLATITSKAYTPVGNSDMGQGSVQNYKASTEQRKRNLPWTTPPDEIKKAFFLAFTPGVAISKWSSEEVPAMCSRAWMSPPGATNTDKWKIPVPKVQDRYGREEIRAKFDSNLAKPARKDIHIDFKVLKGVFGFGAKLKTLSERQKEYNFKVLYTGNGDKFDESVSAGKKSPIVLKKGRAPFFVVIQNTGTATWHAKDFIYLVDKQKTNRSFLQIVHSFSTDKQNNNGHSAIPMKRVFPTNQEHFRQARGIAAASRLEKGYITQKYVEASGFKSSNMSPSIPPGGIFTFVLMIRANPEIFAPSPKEIIYDTGIKSDIHKEFGYWYTRPQKGERTLQLPLRLSAYRDESGVNEFEFGPEVVLDIAVTNE